MDLYSEKAMATHSNTLAWKIPWTEEPGRLQSMGSLRVGHDWVTSLSLFTFSRIGEGNGNPLQYSCLENLRDRVAQSQIRLKWLSSNMELYCYAMLCYAKSLQSCPTPCDPITDTKISLLLRSSTHLLSLSPHLLEFSSLNMPSLLLY